MGDHDYADDYKGHQHGSPPTRSELENSMVQEITIPMSLTDFAKRERFKVAQALLNDTIERMATIVGLDVLPPSHPLFSGTPQKVSWQQQHSSSTITAVQNEMQAYVKTLRSIMKTVKDDDE